jgi:hypothetical protein
MLPKSLARHEPLLLKLLAKSREARFTTAQGILAAVSELIETVPSVDGDSVEVESSAA